MHHLSTPSILLEEVHNFYAVLQMTAQLKFGIHERGVTQLH